MKPIHLLLVAAMAASSAIATSCTKSNDNTTVAPTPIPTVLDTLTVATFQNKADSAFIIDVYGSAGDYAANTNKITTIKLNSGSGLPRTIKTFGTFYVDCYTASYVYSNWFYSNYTDTTQLQSILYRPCAANNGTYTLHKNSADVSADRLILLRGSESTTTWKAVNAYMSKGNGWKPVWDSLSANERAMTMTFNKNFTLNFKDSSGKNKNCLFHHEGNNMALQGGIIFNNNEIGSFSNGNHTPPYSHSFDSLGFQYDNGAVRYIFVRQ